MNARGFASDNSATIHPKVLEAIASANVGHAFGYGHDEYSHSVESRIAAEFGGAADVFLVFNGTGANVVSLQAACQRRQAVICAETAHLNVDEGGAPEAIAGVKLLCAPGEHGKLTPERVQHLIARVGDEHAAQPRVVSVSQSTELGTVYSAAELTELAEVAHGNGLLLQMDGARLSNAAAALDTTMAALSAEVGVDVLSFGGTKNGLLAGEAIVVLEPALAGDFPFLRKQTMQLASKMRFLAAQFDALLTDELWRECAAHANAMAARLAAAVADLPGLDITRPVQTNAVFATLPAAATVSLLERFAFYVWDESAGEVRWMCSWDTTEDDVDAFAAAVAETLAA